MTTPDGTEPDFAPPPPMPAPEPLTFGGEPTTAAAEPAPEPPAIWAAPAPPTDPGYPPGDPAATYPPGYPAATYPPGYPAATYPPGYPAATYPPGYPAATYPPGYPAATYPPGYPVPTSAYPPGYALPPLPPGYPVPSIPPGYPGYIADGYGGGYQIMLAGDLNDPLVTAPGQQFNGWWGRLMRVFRDNWRTLVPVYLIGYLVPLVGASALGVSVSLFGTYTPSTSTDAVTPDLGGFFAGILLLVLFSLVVTGYLSSVAWAATALVITRRAAGRPVTAGESITYGFRRSLPLFGWSVLVALMTGLGTLACVLPGLYLTIATALVIPIAMYVRSGPIGGSFTLVHRFFGPVLGRVLLLFAISTALGIVGFIVQLALEGGPRTGTTSLPIAILASMITGLIGLPGQMLFKIGSILTWAEMTARTAPLSTPAMDAAL